MKANIILQGDALEQLKTLPDESIDCVMTSPPYWALRDYGVEGQLGLESTFEEYINKLCDIFDEVKRVLKKTGTCWVNLGDVYGGSNSFGWKQTVAKKNQSNPSGEGNEYLLKKYGIENKSMSKSLLMIPFRFAIEMVNRGWILRNNIIWHKRNCMPSSVSDRFTVDFEYLFFFTKNKQYYFQTQYEPNHYDGRKVMVAKRKKTEIYRNEIPRWANLEKGRNKRTVWSINPKPFKEAHFAVYPEELCETPIKAGCPKEGIVLDPFFGSGTTGLVALKQNKKFIGIELNKEYIEIANKRLKPYLEQEKL